MLGIIGRNDKISLIFASLIILFNIIILPPLYLFVPIVNFLTLLNFALFILYTFLLFFSKSKLKNLILIIIVALLIIQALSLPYPIILKKAFATLQQFLIWFFFYIPITFLVFFGMYLFKMKPFRHARLVSVLFFVIAAALIFYYNFVIIVSWHMDDEMFIQLLSAKDILNLHNPYESDYSSLLFENLSNFGITATTENKIIGVLDYPALFSLIEVPFIVLPIKIDLILKLQVSLFLYLLFLTIGYLAKKEETAKPSFLILTGILVSLFVLSSSMQALMLLLILIAYSKSGTRYGWLFLGLAASIQEMLWLPVLLLILYTFSNFGLKKGVKELSLTLLVFLIINGPFILLSPYKFLHNVILPATSYIIPDSYGLAGYLITAFYPTGLHAYSLVPSAFIIFSILLMLYLNDKRLVFIISIIPFLFLTHGIVTYYLFFIGAFLISQGLEYKVGRNKISSYKKLILYALVIIVIAIATYVFFAHNAYESNFYIKTLNQSYAVANNTFLYNLTISYKANIPTLTTLFSIYNGSILLYGINGSIIQGANETPNAEMIDTNFIHLNKKGIANIRYKIALPQGIGTFYADPVLFNGSYVYYPPPIMVLAPENKVR
ncbi:MAG: hypothetical protein RXO35_03895 [Candidatus Micrarchaeota archaeon]